MPGIIITCASGHHGQVGDHLLGVLGLAGTRLASDQHGVVLLVLQHVPVGALRNGPEMGRHLSKIGKFIHHQFQGDSNLIPPFSKVNLADPMGVDGVPLVRVDDNL